MSDRDQALTLWAEGVEAPAIAECCGYVDAKAVRDTVAKARKSGDPRASAPRPAFFSRGSAWTEAERNTLRQRIAEGVGYSAIAAELGRPKNAVCGAVFRLGLANKYIAHARSNKGHAKRRGRPPGARAPSRQYLTAIDSETPPSPPSRPAVRVSNPAIPPNDREALAIWNYCRGIDRQEQGRQQARAQGRGRR